MKVLTVVGARPQFVKAAVVSEALRARGELQEVLVHTGQHYDQNMSGLFFEQLRMREPDHSLLVGSLSHGAQTGRMLEQLEELMLSERPDWVLVYGDTNSTLAGALAAAKIHIPVAHVEAGLRSFNRRMPEELNRILTDSLSSVLFTPTEAANVNLRAEGVGDEKVHLVGDVMYDAAIRYGDAESAKEVLEGYGLKPGEFILATIHRAENTDSPERLEVILSALGEVSREIPVLLPLHPRTKARVAQMGLTIDPALRIVEPIGYMEMLALERDAALIVTDSGGVQKEAYFSRTPCLTLRDETEWVELIETGWNQLCSPTDASEVADAIRSRLHKLGQDVDLYGGGLASQRIAEILAGFEVPKGAAVPV